MPFRTRKKKESALGRRVNFIEGGLVSYKAPSVNNVESYGRKAKNGLESGSSVGESYDYVKAELIKIFILAVIIIGLQLALKISNISIF